AERLFGQARRGATGDRALAPLAAADVVVVRQQVAVEHEQEGDGVGADFVNAVVVYVGHGNAMLGGGFQVDHVNANAVARDDLAVGQRVDDAAVNPGPLHQQRIRAVQLRDQVVAA